MVFLDKTQDPSRDQAETKDHRQAPMCNLPMLWPVVLVTLMQGQAELPRALVRRLTGRGWVQSQSDLPGCSSNGQVHGCWGTRSLGILLVGCVSTIELHAVPTG